VLGKYEYFGQYGSISKIVVNKTKAYNPSGPNGPSFSAYISYNKENEASIAILAIDNIEVDGHTLRASYGTTKYCTFFLKNLDCPNKECLYLHHLADDEDLVNRDDMNSNTNIFYEQQLLAMKIADIFNSEIKKKLKNINTKKKCILPTTDSIFVKDIVIEQNNTYNDYKFYENNSNFSKYKKKYNDEYYNNYYKNSKYEYHDGDYFYENQDDDNFLTREKSESFTAKSKNLNSSKKPQFMKIDDEGVSKFISKSKSPIMNKKIAISTDKDLALSVNTKTTVNSLSPIPNSSKKVDLEEIEEKNLDNKNTQLNFNNPPLKKLYRKREESRFSFVKCTKEEESKISTSNKNNINVIKNPLDYNSPNEDATNIVPDYVCDVICKKISRHTFFKKFEKYFDKENNDYEFFEKDLKQNDSWSSFILSNMTKEKVGPVSIEKIK
jgi:CCR4-NOT transcription complex subunit 4